MHIVIDNNIPYIYTLFGKNNVIQTYDGRFLSFKQLKNTDALIVRSTTIVDDVLLDGSNVKFIGTATAGIDHVDQNFLKKSKINFVSASGSNAIAVVEYVFSALLCLAQRDGFFLRDKVVGIVGVGNIGKLLHHRLRIFGVHTLLCDPPLQKIFFHRDWKSLETLVKESDILTFHTPLIYDGEYPTWHMVDLDLLESLSSNSILINTCRGSVFDNSALLKVLKAGKKLKIVLDVWENEPKISLPLLSYIDIGTPHIAGYTYESKVRSIVQIYKEYCKFYNIIDNKIEIFRLYPSIVYRMKLRDTVSEIVLFKLVRLIYNIYSDHFKLRRFAHISGGFDSLRKFYDVRREWSAFCVNTKSEYDNHMLNCLGFNSVQ